MAAQRMGFSAGRDVKLSVRDYGTPPEIIGGECCFDQRFQIKDYFNALIVDGSVNRRITGQ
jgi:hypothetical protein